jgi:DNA-binding NarL/FixJ family response regulator
LASRFCEALGGGAEPILRCITAASDINLKKACQKYKPTVLIAETSLIEKHTEALRGLDSKLKVIAISAPGGNVSGSLRLYLDACLPRDIGFESLRAAVSGVLCGLTVYSGESTLGRTEDAVRRYGLSEIEQSILCMIGQGFSSEKIAAALHYSHGSLRNMLSAMYVRLGIGDRAQLTAFAILNGFADSFQGGSNT